MASHDLHILTAAEALGISPEMVTEEQRRAAKTINFGLHYGMGSRGLMEVMERNAPTSGIEQLIASLPGPFGLPPGFPRSLPVVLGDACFDSRNDDFLWWWGY